MPICARSDVGHQGKRRKVPSCPASCKDFNTCLLPKLGLMKKRSLSAAQAMKRHLERAGKSVQGNIQAKPYVTRAIMTSTWSGILPPHHIRLPMHELR